MDRQCDRLGVIKKAAAPRGEEESIAIKDRCIGEIFN